jgi:hypothetical protein
MLAYNDGQLYIANNQILYLLECDESFEPGEEKEIELDEMQIHKIIPG